MKRLLKTFKERLADLSGNSKLLMHAQLRKTQDLDLFDTDFLLEDSAFGIIKKVVEGARVIKLCAVSDPRNERVNLVSRRLRQIYRQTRLIWQERGTYDLQVGFPYVHGKLNEQVNVRCPLLLFPAHLELEQNVWVLKFEDEPQFNKAFLLAYRHYVGAHELEAESSPGVTDYKSFAVQLINLCNEKGMKLQFSRELFEERLKPFLPILKKDQGLLFQTGVLKVVGEAVLGLYPTAWAQTEQDYELLLESENLGTIEELFMSKNQPSSKIKEEHAIFPFELDASQEDVLMRVKRGESLVVQGPPGTGKSQLIANLMADAMANGKTALLVCDKKVALEVVESRLESKGLGDYVALVHDYQSEKTSLYQKIARRIKNIDELRKRYSSFGTIQLERDFIHTSREIQRLNEELGRLKEALFSDKPYGVSIKELYLLDTSITDSFDTNWLENTDYSHWKNTSRLSLLWVKYKKRADEKAGIWKYRKSWAHQSNVEEIQKKLSKWHDFSTKSLDGYSTFDSNLLLMGKKKELEHLNTLLADKLAKNAYQIFKDNKTELNHQKKELKKAMDTLPKYVQQLEWSVFSELHAEHEYCHKIRKKWGASWLCRLISNRYKKHHELVKTYERNGDWEKWAESLHILGIAWDKLAKIDPERAHTTNCLDVLSRTYGDVQQIFKLIEETKNLGTRKGNTVEDLFNFISTLLHQLSFFESTYLEVRNDLTDDFLRAYDPKLYNDTLQRLKSEFENLRSLDTLEKVELSANDLNILNWNYHRSHKTEEEFAENVFGSIVHTAIEDLEQKRPVLRELSAEKTNWLENTLKDLVEKKLQIALSIAQIWTGEKAYTNLQKNRLGNVTTYRDLLHECEKKRKILPLRQMIDRYFHEIKHLLPCWAVSPRTASAIFPLKEYFDLVIFDEASQCFAEEAFTMIFRGKQLLVAGDSKQLSPSMLYTARLENEEEDILDTQVDSWLDLCSRHLPESMLKGHYRSQFTELIAFSNKHFYDSKLQLIPRFIDGEKEMSALRYQHLPMGRWANQSNLVEAEWIVNEILSKLNQSGAEKIGIITMNYPQQQLVMDLLEKKTIASGKLLDDSTFFVKNIENVQGDEADHIYLSLGYAKDEAGKVRANFGLLNTEGGSNRLNVAITRAKKSLTLVTSLLPQEIPYENTKNQGPKLLYEFAKFVYQHQTSKNQLIETSDGPTHLLLNYLVKNHDYTYFEYPEVLRKKQSPANHLYLTDDELYYRESSKSFHAYLPKAFEQRGWKVEKIWSREYWKSKQLSKTTP